jgi:hypothetical protein
MIKFNDIIAMTTKGELAIVKTKTGYDVVMRLNPLDAYSVNILNVGKNGLDIAQEYYNYQVISKGYKNIPYNKL